MSSLQCRMEAPRGLASALIKNAREIKSRLRNPPNKVVDDGIDLKRKKGFQPTEVRALPQPEFAAYKAACLAQARIHEAETIAIEGAANVAEAQARRKGFTDKQQAKRIIARVAENYGYLPSDITGDVRTALLVIARHKAMYAVHRITRRSLPWTGRVFDRDHTTVLHAIRKVESRRTSDLVVDAEMAELERAFTKQGAAQ